MIRPTLLFTALYATLAGCDRPPQPAASPERAGRPQESAGIAAPPAFAACNGCHAAGPGQHGIGPSLAGVSGRAAAGAPGYGYSPALRRSGLRWDDATLHEFLADPRATVPGTSMAYAGMRDAARRQAIIDWLKTI
jgi:cytochrome c